ncbi:hypothetical protein BFJ63_vAg18601, partial [Fusarium oxysporum f. sp. narcissi]
TLLAGAKTILSCYDKIPDDLCKLLIDQRRVEAKTWDQLFKDQDAPFPIGNGERWQADNLYSVPQVPRDEVTHQSHQADHVRPTNQEIDKYALDLRLLP